MAKKKKDTNYTLYIIISSIITLLLSLISAIFIIIIIYYIYKKAKPIISETKQVAKFGGKTIKIITMIVSLIASFEDLGADVLEVGADVPTAGAGHVVSGPLTFVNEILVEAIQSTIITVCVIFIDSGTFFGKTLRIVITILLSLFDVITAFISMFIPFSGIVELILNIITESLQNILLAYSLFFT